jgi:hypothetical protein
MTDRELLELAAKAAKNEGMDIEFDSDCGKAFDRQAHEWNPLTNDGDALRLAVKLGIEVLPDREISEVQTAFCIRRNGRLVGLNTFEKFATDEMAATRRAIVRAAAEIGRTML